MKLFFFTASFFLLMSYAIKAQSPDCKKFRNGSFKMESNGITSFIERKGKRQSEKSPARAGTYHFKVRWINKCTYTLVPTKGTMKETLFRDLPKNAMLTITITEVKENSYIQTSTANFTDMILTSEVFSIH